MEKIYGLSHTKWNGKSQKNIQCGGFEDDVHMLIEKPSKISVSSFMGYLRRVNFHHKKTCFFYLDIILLLIL